MEGNDDVTFRLKAKAANDLEHNQIQVDKRGKKLVVEGAFRTLDKQEKSTGPSSQYIPKNYTSWIRSKEGR